MFYYCFICFFCLGFGPAAPAPEKKYKAIIFDLDGVLLDTEKIHSEIWTRTAKLYGTSLNQQQITLLKGRRRLECIQQIIQWTNKSIKVQDFISVHEPISKQLMKQVKEFASI